MKKYVILCFASLVLILSILFTGGAVKGSVAKSDYIVMRTTTGETTVTCSGKVEEAARKNVYAETTGTAKEVYVKVGDSVKKGDVLMCLSYQEGTAAGTGSSSSSSSSSASAGGDSSLPDLSGLSDEELAAAMQTYQNYLGQSSSEGNSSSSSSTQPSGSVEETKLKNVTAPTDGIVTKVNVEGEDGVKSYQPVVVLADSQKLQVRLSVNESQVSDLRVGQECVITGVGFKNSTYTGEIKSISNSAKQKTGMTGQETVVEVVVSVDNPGNDIKSGFTAKCKITTAKDNGLLVAPYDAVRADEDGTEYVYVLTENNTAERRVILTGKELANGFEVLEGIAQGDKVLLSPDRISPEQKVIGQEKGLVQTDA